MFLSEVGQILQTFLRLEKLRAVEQLVYTNVIESGALTKARTTVENMDMVLNLPDWLDSLREDQVEKKEIKSYSDI